jgi:predicted nucleotidyltransferase component of viral defense system
MLDIIFSHKLGRKLSFIGGTSLRILYGIDRFSEDLDFSLKAKDFNKLTFDQNESQKILLFPEYIKQKKFKNIV